MGGPEAQSEEFCLNPQFVVENSDFVPRIC